MPTRKKKAPQKGRPAEIDPTQLQDIAEALIAERGFDGTTTREIAARAGCNVAMISYHFGSKDGLYKSLLKRYLQRIRTSSLDKTVSENLKEEWPELTSEEERKLCAVLFGVGRVVVLENRMHKIMCRELMSGGKNILELFTGGDYGVIIPIRDTISELIKQGVLSPKLDPRLATISLMGSLVYSNIAGPLIRTIYGMQTDETYVRKLCIQLTRTLFGAWTA